MTAVKENTYGYSRKTGEARLFEAGKTMPDEFSTVPPPGVHNHDKERGIKFVPESDPDPDGNPPSTTETPKANPPKPTDTAAKAEEERRAMHAQTKVRG